MPKLASKNGRAPRFASTTKYDAHHNVLSKTYGALAPDKSNVILYPTSYGAHHTDIDWLIGRDRVLDPERYFIVVPNQFGNGLSTSPSNLAEPFGLGQFNGFLDDQLAAQPRRVASGGQFAGAAPGFANGLWCTHCVKLNLQVRQNPRLFDRLSKNT